MWAMEGIKKDIIFLDLFMVSLIYFYLYKLNLSIDKKNYLGQRTIR
jgi:hypothetical protein